MPEFDVEDGWKLDPGPRVYGPARCDKIYPTFDPYDFVVPDPVVTVTPEEAEAIKAAQELNRLMENERPKSNEIPRSRQELLSYHETLCGRAREIMKRKNHDYASDSDPYRNFRMFGPFGILVRMGDKFSRLQSFEETGEMKVTDESLEDTVLDLINYSILYLGMKTE